MTIRNGIITLILAVLIGIAGWYIYSNSQSLPHVLTESGDRQQKEETDYYTVQVVYPNATRLATRTDSSKAADERAVSTIERELQDVVQAFKSAANAALTADEKERLAAAKLKYSLNVAYRGYNSGSFVSEEFDIFQDTGGAHPINFYKTLVFDLKGNKVSLDGIFVSGSNYLERISTEATKQVGQQLTQKGAGANATTSLVAEGVAPKAENFTNFVVNDGVLTFFIPPYQAASYAAGSFEVRIPLLDMKDIVKPGIQ
jgi:hypothetical protein